MKFKTPRFIKRLYHFLNGIHIPFLGVSLYQIFKIYIQGIFRGNIGRKAGAISWSFFFSLFPLLLFLLSVLPYMPHYEKLQFYIFDVFLHNIIPSSMEKDIIGYIKENLITKTSSLSNLTIILTLIFATNGTFALIDGFNDDTEEKHHDVKEYLIAFGITLGFVSALFLTLFGIYYSEVVLKLFEPKSALSWFVTNLTKIIGLVWFPLLYFLMLTLFYWVGTAKITRFKQAIPGALLTTVLFFLTTFLFAFYVSNFARYNVLYGSIGSIILLMLWININVYLLLFGNELNIVIRKVRIEKKKSDERKNTK
ncbi:YihY/virulence factor BrkB family protein [Bergeyella zoohelcum]|uniref:YihY family protein n=2 Tax=Bergeyella zoohelcum TaxID=1015 RepID=K1LM23_9FLAO|nr:YihY/virulence factor BrkB family protein [Bergeyella zoohelcum]EKB57850.1 YihY family protein [Bergeyella zoohelcum ATCC 43767]EKB58240.1 YihY family protein [Bergeyella zoohelcum CCUG 30536]SSZ55817.1 YihY family inner membrane protein [Bergeyella zoohelcum]SUV48979.1 YihY family inner membrane protein [Bergeyella zoohelcum]